MGTLWIVLYLVIGLVIGVISGILGIGGGVLLVPILMWCGFKYKQATGTTLAVLVPPIGLPAAWKAYQEGQVDLGTAACIAGAFTVGAYYGRSVCDYIDPGVFKLCFGLFMMFVAMRFIISGSDEAMMAVMGLMASAAALLAYAGLYLLGRRHLNARTDGTAAITAPNGQPSALDTAKSGLDLGQNIRTSRDEGFTDPDYYI
jgi:uncharacterized membrane protein YfcA